MNFVIWLGIVGVAIVASILLFEWAAKHHGVEFLDFLPVRYRWIAGVAVVLAFFSPAFLEVPTSSFSPVYTWDENGAMEEHSIGTFCVWGFHECPKLEPAVLSGSVTPITENPKVRTIKIWIEIQVNNPERFFQREYRRGLGFAGDAANASGSPVYSLNSLRVGEVARFISDELAQTTGFRLHAFFDERSVELSRFSNPLDPSQHEELRVLVETYMNPRLEGDGMTVVFGGFELS